MKTPLSVAVVGVGGYGQTYLRMLLNPKLDLPVKMIAGIDPFAQSSPMYPDLVAAGIPLYDTLDAFYAEHTADLVIISSPIHLHKPQSIYCMEHGSHVLCEKPVSATIDDVEEMIEARDRTGKLLNIGYQWSFSDAIHQLKADILADKYGKALRFKTIVLWPRSQDYYHRGSGWAAHKKTAGGDWILDSVASNATAHYLHNMLYVSGKSMDRSARIEEIEVETYRANPIEMFDTCALRAYTSEGAELLYLVSHAIASEEIRNPEFIYEFEKGTVVTQNMDGVCHVIGTLQDGTKIDYGDPFEGTGLKLQRTVEMILGQCEPICGPEAASTHTKCINRIEELIPDTPHFPEDRVHYDEPTRIYYCEGLATLLSRCYEEWKLPSEAEPGSFFHAQKGIIGDYDHFTPAK